MNVLKSAMVGIFLVLANTAVRADVIGDWNNTAVDVMKAVNVGGKTPWTRSMALVNVSMSDAVNSVQNRYTRYPPRCQVARTRRRRPPQPRQPAKCAAPAPRPKRADRGRLCRNDQGHSGQPRQDPGHYVRRKSCGRGAHRTR